jgi:hypothetical protein
LRHGRIFSTGELSGKQETTGELGSGIFHDPPQRKARDQES